MWLWNVSVGDQSSINYKKSLIILPKIIGVFWNIFFSNILKIFSWMLFHLREIRVTPIKSRLVTFITRKFVINKLKLLIKCLQMINHHKYTINIRNGNIKPLYPSTKEQ